MLRLIESLSFLWLLMAISTIAQSPPVLDAGGEPLRSGVEYLADPAVADVAGSLTLVARNGSCPFYVGQESARSGRRGIPVIFTPRNPQETIITESTEVTVTFSGVSTCVRNTAWTIGGEDPQTRRRFVVTGAEPSYFQINSRNQLGGSYTFQGCPQCVDEPDCGRATCGTAGILIQNGTRFLVLDGPEFTFMFGPPVLDTDGNPVTRGVEYYVDPAVTDVAGGLTLVTRNGSCPSYVGQVPIGPGNVQGLPVIFSPRNSGETVITENTQFTVAFSAATICVTDTTWGIGEEDPETTRRLIVIGDEPAIFSISRNQAPGPYTFGYCPECNTPPPCGRPRCGIAGILEQNGTRFLTIDGPAFPFSFRRA
ncbi:hypothetical protein POTOM_027508 [Populus tomentosa]|uniref:Uncharacterized protein n=1 Tax=Populus tomentosa TaxID=118781 RepID=A0A8X7ZFV6_POPTO|nr:hypothetical protein POTOM_027508 [Populus tomentosa]